MCCVSRAGLRGFNANQLVQAHYGSPCGSAPDHHGQLLVLQGRLYMVAELMSHDLWHALTDATLKQQVTWAQR